MLRAKIKFIDCKTYSEVQIELLSKSKKDRILAREIKNMVRGKYSSTRQLDVGILPDLKHDPPLETDIICIVQKKKV